MKKIIITGSAPCAMEDIENIPGYREFDFMAVVLDAVGVFTWRADYVVTYHPEDIPAIAAKRLYFGNMDYKVISHEAHPGVDIIEPHIKPSGSSALLGTLASIRMGYNKIILCGCPLEGMNVKNGNYANFQKGWEARAGEFDDKVRSMSGWTAKFLGQPDREWLDGNDH